MKTPVCATIYLLIALIVFACSDEDFLINSSNTTTTTNVSVKGTFAESTYTRMGYTMDESSISCSWVSGDTIAIVSDVQTAPLLYKAMTDSAYTDFQQLGDGLDGEDGDVHYAWYPYQTSSPHTYPSAVLPTLAQQSYSGGNLPASLDFVHATATQSNHELQFAFSHIFAFLCISVYSEELSGSAGLVITSTESIAYADGATYDLMNDTLDATLQNTIVYTIDDETLVSGRKIHCYVAILPTSSESVITVSKMESDGTVGDVLFTKSAPVLGFQASHVYTTTIESEDAERYALIALYNATDGENWTSKDGWCTNSNLSAWTGVTVSKSHVTKLSLSDCNLVGEIPEELSDLTYLTSLNLHNNNLTGEIPSSLGNLSNLLQLYLYDNNLTGEIPSSLGNLTNLQYLHLFNNNLTGEIPSSLGNLTNLQSLKLHSNNLTGNIPTSLTNLTALELIYIYGNRMSGTVPDEIISCCWWPSMEETELLAYILSQQHGYGLLLPYKLHDYTVHILQEHSQGMGITIVIMGEAYTQSLIDDGTYAKHVGWAYNSLFALEPYTTFQDYFDVYYIDIPSEDDELGGDTAFGVYYETTRNTMTFDPSIPRDILAKMEETNYSYCDVTSVILVNSSLSIRSRAVRSNSTGFSAGYCLVSNESSLGGLVNHEALGHGFGKLADEYVEYDTYISDEEIEALKENQTKYNVYVNVDVTADCDSVLWSNFIYDSHYVQEGIGIFEGAYTYAYGVYRPTNTSIMRISSLNYSFNAPSRQNIYRRIMELSGKDYSFEDFLEYDKGNSANYISIARKGSTEDDANLLRGASPIEVEW